MSSMGLKIFFTIILNFLLLNLVKTCSEDPKKLDPHFVACCRGRPKYTSEPCIDSLLENGTFSSVCLLDCMYKEFEFYDGTKIDLTGVKTFLTKQIGDKDFNLMYMNAFEICSKLDKASIEETFSFINLDNEHNCDDYPQFIDICVWYHTLANCPENYAADDETCYYKSKWVNECLLQS